MKKKILSIMLSLALMVTMMPMQYVDAASKTKAKTTVTVSTQSGLNKALKNKKLKTLTISTTSKKTFTIKKGTYTNLKLVVNASKGTVKNYAKFKNIVVKKIAKNTWKEYAKGNVLSAEAKTGHFVVAKDAYFKKVMVGTKDSKLTFNVLGSIKRVDVSEKSQIGFTGKTDETVKVNILESAGGTVISSDARVNVAVYADATINLNKGAEWSNVTTYIDEAVKVNNNTEKDVTYTNKKNAAGGALESGKNLDLNTVQPTSGTNVGTGGTSGGGGGGGTPSPTPTETKHVVTFVGGKGGTKTVNHGGQITSADANSKVNDKTGYEFAGWYTDDEYTTPAVFPVTVNEDDITFYAKYNPITYTIYFHKNKQDTSLDKNQVCEYDKLHILKSNPYQAEDGYEFVGWSKVSADGIRDYVDGASIFNLADVSGAAIHLYALWKEKDSDVDPTQIQFTIELNLNGHGNINKTSFKVVSGEAYGSTLNESNYTPTATGYIFGGWYDNQECTGSKVETTDRPTGSTTLYAKWTPITYTVNYHPNGASDNGEMTPSTFTYGTGANLKANKFELFGYEFAGWSLSEATGSAIAYANNSFVLNLKSTSGDAVDLYAQWVEKQYDNVLIQYMSGNTEKGTVTNTVDAIHPLKGTPTGSRAIPAEGCEFVGWFCNGVSCDSGEALVPEKVNGEYKAAIYTAQFKGKSYTIHYDINNINSYQALSADAMEDQVLEYGDVANLNKNQFKLINCDMAFVGWNTQPDGRGEFFADEQQVRNLRDDGSEITLYAQWHHPIGGKMVTTLDKLWQDFVNYFTLYKYNGEEIDLSAFGNEYDGYDPALLNEAAYYETSTWASAPDMSWFRVFATVDGKPDGDILEKKLQYGGYGTYLNIDYQTGVPYQDEAYDNCDCGDCEILSDDTLWGWIKTQNENSLNGCSNWRAAENLNNLPMDRFGFDSDKEYWDTYDYTGADLEYYAHTYNPTIETTFKYRSLLKHYNAYGILVRTFPGQQQFCTLQNGNPGDSDFMEVKIAIPEGDNYVGLPSADMFDSGDDRKVFAGWRNTGNELHVASGESGWANETYQACWAFSFGGKLVKKNCEDRNPNNYSGSQYDTWGVFDADGNNIFQQFRNYQISYDDFVSKANSFGYVGNNEFERAGVEESILNEIGQYVFVVPTEDGTANSDILVAKNIQWGGNESERINEEINWRNSIKEVFEEGDTRFGTILEDASGDSNTIWAWAKDFMSNNSYDNWQYPFDTNLFKDFRGLCLDAGITDSVWLKNIASGGNVPIELVQQFEASTSSNADMLGQINIVNETLNNGKGIKGPWENNFTDFDTFIKGNLTAENISNMISIYNKTINSGKVALQGYASIANGASWDDIDAATARAMKAFPDELINSGDQAVQSMIATADADVRRHINKSGGGFECEEEAFNIAVRAYLGYQVDAIKKTLPQKAEAFDVNESTNVSKKRTEAASAFLYREIAWTYSTQYGTRRTATLFADNGTDEKATVQEKNGMIQLLNKQTGKVNFEIPEGKAFIGWGFQPNGTVYIRADRTEVGYQEIIDFIYPNYASEAHGALEWDGKLYAQWADSIGGKIIGINEALRNDASVIGEYRTKITFYDQSGGEVDWANVTDQGHGQYQLEQLYDWQLQQVVAYKLNKEISIDDDLFYIAATDSDGNILQYSGNCGNIGEVSAPTGTSGMFNTLNALNYGAANNSGSIWDMAKSWNETKLNGYDDWFIGTRQDMDAFFNNYANGDTYWTSDIEGGKLYAGSMSGSYNLENSGDYKVVPIRPFSDSNVHRVYFGGAISELPMQVCKTNGLVDLPGNRDLPNGSVPDGKELDYYSTLPDGSGKAYQIRKYEIKVNMILYPQWKQGRPRP